MLRRHILEGVCLAIIALLTALSCGDGIVGGTGPGGGMDTPAAADTAVDTLPPEDLSTPDILPDTATDTPQTDTMDTTDVDTPDEVAPPDEVDPGCWSCTTNDPECLCGCVRCHTDKPRLQELAPEEEEPEEGGGG